MGAPLPPNPSSFHAKSLLQIELGQGGQAIGSRTTHPLEDESRPDFPGGVGGGGQCGEEQRPEDPSHQSLGPDEAADLLVNS